MADDTHDPMSDLRGADPAQGAPEPDIAAIRARAAEQAAVVPIRGRRTAVAVGAIAAGVAVLAGVGLAGAAVGRLTAPAPEVVAAPVADDALPVVGDASPPIPVVAGQPNAGPAASGAEMGVMASADKAMAIYPGYGAAIVAGPDLVDEPGTAAGYRLDRATVDLQALARQLGTAFGIDEQPVKQEYGWTVGSTDGSGPSIWVGDDATVSWSFADPNQDPWSCGVTPEPAPADAAQTSPAGDREACDPEVAPIGQREALREARK
ncbi:MAG: hypothetical protein ACO4CO_10505, partial [Candidatus Nanopelagicales bacterium]